MSDLYLSELIDKWKASPVHCRKNRRKTLIIVHLMLASRFTQTHFHNGPDPIYDLKVYKL
jgi:hypothetical protein